MKEGTEPLLSFHTVKGNYVIDNKSHYSHYSHYSNCESM
ncbi:hypothetical protein PAUR_b1294 [Pseudoalteromonas aurantia 208]|uniref:Uncharacterized protein n=1 Tax=Pseudoalteromonas aurantia 208 TaxID=1314867 RepID=A0ABR9EJD6_9GAMM|nr:hypothetical protein [Pseudoalteromonas aurantia 208]